MKSKSLMFWLALLFVFAGTMIVWAAFRRRGLSGSQVATTVSLPDSTPLEDFVLTERSGQKFESSSLDGKAWVASFFFTSCPQDCWRQNLQIKDLVDVYGEKGITFVSITCDPERDTPLKLAEYADRLRATEKHWLFLTGPLPYIQRLGDDIFKVSVSPTTHSKKLILIERTGDVRGFFSWNDPVQIQLLREELDKMLASEPSA